MKTIVELDLTDNPLIGCVVEVEIQSAPDGYVFARVDPVWRYHPSGLDPLWEAIDRQTVFSVDQIDFE